MCARVNMTPSFASWSRCGVTASFSPAAPREGRMSADTMKSTFFAPGGAGVEAVDYLFFRYYNGHSLNLNKLRARLLPDVSGAAYACQCSWQSLAGLKELSRWGTPPGTEGGTGGGGASLRWLPVAE